MTYGLAFTMKKKFSLKFKV